MSSLTRKSKKAAIEVNKSLLINSVTSALKGKTFKANVDVVVKTASVQDAIKQGFRKSRDELQHNGK